MPLSTIENMTFAELRAQKAALIEAAAKEPVPELAARYVQGRTDAKQRDERMAEMSRDRDVALTQAASYGDSLAQVQLVLTAALERVVGLEAALGQSKADHATEVETQTALGKQLREQHKEAVAVLAEGFRAVADKAKDDAAQALADALAQAEALRFSEAEIAAKDRQEASAKLRDEIKTLKAELAECHAFMATELGRRQATAVIAQKQAELESLKARVAQE